VGRELKDELLPHHSGGAKDANINPLRFHDDPS
jgi:hypothetical protein